MTSHYLLLVSSVFGGYRLSRSIQKDLEDVAILRSIPDFFGFSCFEAEFSYPRPPKLSWVLPIPMLSQIVTDLNHWVGTLASDQLPREASAGCSVYFAKGKKCHVNDSNITGETCRNVLKRCGSRMLGGPIPMSGDLDPSDESTTGAKSGPSLRTEDPDKDFL